MASPHREGRGTLDPRAVAAAEALLARADALEHEHAREIAALNARVRAAERDAASPRARRWRKRRLRGAASTWSQWRRTRLRRRSDDARERRRRRRRRWRVKEASRAGKGARGRVEALRAGLAAETEGGQSDGRGRVGRRSWRAKRTKRGFGADVAIAGHVRGEGGVVRVVRAADGGSERRGPFSRKLANGQAGRPAPTKSELDEAR